MRNSGKDPNPKGPSVSEESREGRGGEGGRIADRWSQASQGDTDNHRKSGREKKTNLCPNTAQDKAIIASKGKRIWIGYEMMMKNVYI
ncbi:MAG: hypothetical protein MJZ41_09645 [Bacteroidaceae bacterium]|nr:hypothetical protein [Bacteroidaceae bacterium]